MTGVSRATANDSQQAHLLGGAEWWRLVCVATHRSRSHASCHARVRALQDSSAALTFGRPQERAFSLNYGYRGMRLIAPKTRMAVIAGVSVGSANVPARPTHTPLQLFKWSDQPPPHPRGGCSASAAAAAATLRAARQGGPGSFGVSQPYERAPI
eukprot:846529-Prymnesium_polylepis.1